MWSQPIWIPGTDGILDNWGPENKNEVAQDKVQLNSNPENNKKYYLLNFKQGKIMYTIRSYR